MDTKEYFNVAINAVFRQLEESPGLPVPVDSDVAEQMGAFVDDAMSYEDVLNTGELEGE